MTNHQDLTSLPTKYQKSSTKTHFSNYLHIQRNAKSPLFSTIWKLSTIIRLFRNLNLVFKQNSLLCTKFIENRPNYILVQKETMLSRYFFQMQRRFSIDCCTKTCYSNLNYFDLYRIIWLFVLISKTDLTQSDMEAHTYLTFVLKLGYPKEVTFLLIYLIFIRQIYLQHFDHLPRRHHNTLSQK